VDKQLAITNIPTLLKWTTNGPTSLRLVEDECLQDGKLNELIKIK
jgi:hypothetical protein